MLPRPFDGEPERWFWLHGQADADKDTASLQALSSAWGRGPPRSVGLLGAMPATAESLARTGAAVSVRDADLQRVLALQHRVGPGSPLEVQARTGGLPAGLDAVLAPACIVSHLDEEGLRAHLLDVARALRRGGVYVAEVWHPRLSDPESGPVRSTQLHASGTLPGGRARFVIDYGRRPPPLMNVTVHVERSSGLPLASSTGQVRLLTLPEWRAHVRQTPGLEEAALLGPLHGRRTFHPEFGDRCTLVLVRAA